MSDLGITVSVTNLASDVLKSIGGDFSQFGDNLKGKFGEVGSALERMLTDPLEGGKELVKLLGDDLLGTVSGLGTVGGVAAAGLGGVAVAAAAVAGTVYGLASSAAEAGDEIKDFSEKSGIAVENVGKWDFATKAAGGSLNDLQGILTKMNVQAATDQTGRFAAALQDVGINADAFKKMDSEQQLQAIAKGFQEGSKSGNDMATAVALMGKSGVENIPLLRNLTGELLEQGQKLGVQWSQDTVNAADDFKVGVQTVETALGSITDRIGAKLLPTVADMITSFATSDGFMNAVTGTATVLSDGLGLVVDVVGHLTQGAIDLLAPVVSVGTFLGSLMIDAVSGLVDWISQLIGWFGKFSIVQDTISLLGGVFTEFKNLAVGAFESILGYLEKLPIVGPKIAAAIDHASSAFHGMVDAGGKVGDASDRVAGALLGQATASDTSATAAERHNRAHTDGLEASAKYEKAVQTLTDKLLGEHQSQQQTSDAIDRAIASGSTDVEVKERIVAEIEKLVKGHQTLTAAQKTFWDQNAALGGDMKKDIAEVQKLHGDLAAQIDKDNNGTLAGALTANKGWYDDEVAKLGDLNLTNDQREAHLAVLRDTRAQKDKEALDAQATREKVFDSDSRDLWDAHYLYLGTKAGDDTTAKIGQIDHWLEKEKDKLDQDKDVTWPQYYARLAVLEQTAEDKKDQVLRDRKKAEDTARNENTLLWDTYYTQLAKLHKTSAMDVEVQQVKDSLQQQLDALDRSKPDWENKYDAIVAIAGVHMDQIRQDYHDKAIQPLIDDTENILKAGIEHGWSGVKDSIKSICGEILSYFEHQFVVALIGYATGVHNAWSSAFSGIINGASALGGLGAGAGAAGAGAAGTGAAGAGGAAAAGAAGAAAGGGAGGAAGGGGGAAAAGAVATIGAVALIGYEIWSHGGVGDPEQAEVDHQAAIDEALAYSNGQYYNEDGSPTMAGLLDPGGGQGYARGGVIRRPNGLDPSDTINIWAAEGEGIVTRTGMRVLGEDGLNALNQGQLPTAASAGPVVFAPVVNSTFGNPSEIRKTIASLFPAFVEHVRLSGTARAQINEALG